MSSAAKAKPVVLAVWVADAGGPDGNGSVSDAAARVGEGEAAAPGGADDPHAARSSEAKTTNEAKMRARHLGGNETTPNGMSTVEPSEAQSSSADGDR